MQLHAVLKDTAGMQRALAAKEQFVIALREELAEAVRERSEANHKLRAQRRQVAPWR